MNKEEAIKRIRDFGLYHAIEDLPFSTRTVEAFKMAIQALEEPDREHGKWIELAKCSYACSKCNIICYTRKPFNFCPNCGAKMSQEITDNIKDDDISWTDLRWYLSEGKRI